MIKSAYHLLRNSSLASKVYKKFVPESARIKVFNTLSGERRAAVMSAQISEEPLHSLMHSGILRNRQPLVTVVVTAFNDSDYLEMCLQSVELQCYKNIECIIVDDFSTDQSTRIARKFVSKDSRFSLVCHKANGGLPAARNTGVAASRGEYICFLDGDDYIYEGSISNRVLPLLKIQDPAVAGTWCRWDPVPYFSEEIPAIRPVDERLDEIDFLSAAGDCPFIATSPLITREAFYTVGGFDESLDQAEDWDFWQRLMRKGYRFTPCNYFAVAYRQKSNSMMRNGIVTHFKTSKSLLQRAYSFTNDENGIGLYKSWSHYKQLSLLSKRIISSLTIAAINGHEVDEIIEQFDGHDWAFIVNNVDMLREVRSGVIRAQGLSGCDLRPEKTQLEKLSRRIVSTLVDKLPALASSLPERSCEKYDVIFIPHKDYHVVSLIDVKSEIERFGGRVGVLDISYAYRDEGVRKTAKKFDLELIPYNYYLLGSVQSSKLVCFNDWDTNVVRPLIEHANKNGIETFGIVEGVQDFTDADTGRERNPYKTVKNVLLAGRYDYQFFDDSRQGLFCYGVPRLKALLQEKVNWPIDPLVVINMNFSYGVLTDCAEEWLGSVVSACQQLGVDYVISRHPADKTEMDERYVSDKSMYDLIREGTVFVSRFGSGILEALAMGKYAIYHNPHNEKVIKFSDKDAPLANTSSTSTLVDELREVISLAGHEDVRALYHDYLDQHCNIENLSHMDSKAAEFILYGKSPLQVVAGELTAYGEHDHSN